MALIKCKECGQQVSSRALKCPHCGAPASASPQIAIGIVTALMGVLLFAGLLASRASLGPDVPLVASIAVGIAVVAVGLGWLVLKLRAGR
jgi:hypothetical protein